MINAIVTFKLAYPYNKSTQLIQDLVSVWDLRLITSSMDSDTTVVSVPWKKFKDIFGSNPQVGGIAVPIKLQKFVHNIIVDQVMVDE